MSRVFITGDCHRDFRKLAFHNFPAGRDLTKDDFMIICGDFGFWHDSPEQTYWMNWLEERRFTILFVDGNHEDFDRLYAMPVEKWHGGNIHRIRPHVIHLMRGQVYEIGGKTFFTFGGARSHDIEDGILEPDDPFFEEKRKRLRRRSAQFRINHVSWWAQEMPSKEEMEAGIKSLEDADWSVDYIITHCCFSRFLNAVYGSNLPADPLTDYFDIIIKRTKYRHWYFGHYHLDEECGARKTCLYHNIVELNDTGHVLCLPEKLPFKFLDKVVFTTYDRQARQIELRGTILRIDRDGGSIYSDEPTATIRARDRTTHRSIPLRDVRKDDGSDA